ncbi:MAG: hypothetical protein LWX51_10695 [Deltaproteobacteria bacterium]|jgi:hypothetical protein|nr:hypothetical protein [Deltaproteobacteria bacterium]
MPNKIYRDRLINNISYAVKEAATAQTLKHPGITGRIRELLVSHLYEPVLPAGYEIGTGKICNNYGDISGEVDLIIYNKSILPPVMHSEREGIFPFEACYYAFEVKSMVSAKQIKDAINKGKKIINIVPGNNKHNVIPVVLTFFAFNSDLSGKGITEIERYAKYDPNWKNDPVIKAICIVGKGYWYHNQNISGWTFHPPSSDFDEVVDIISGTVNTLAKNPAYLRKALLGHYLMRIRATQNII